MFASRAVYPAGPRPARRTGHVSIYDKSLNTLFVSFGITDGGRLLDDTWKLDLSINAWSCIFGNGPGCLKRHPPLGPGELAFPHLASVGLYKLVYGGMKWKQSPCPGSTSQFRNVPQSVGSMFALNLATFFWEVVDIPAGQAPPNRTLGTMVLAPSVVGYKTPLILFGGADLSGGGVPQVMDSVWICDGALNDLGGASASGEKTDKMAEFDGIDDIISIQLPTWCKSVRSMSVFAVDFWTFFTVSGTSKSIFVDAYSDGSAILRWYATMDGVGNLYFSLVMPGKVILDFPIAPTPHTP
jgi:hypothetical protein